jgi:hypothetical protein
MIFLKTALSVTAIVLFIGTASFAEGGDPGEQAEATGMPTPLSGASQKAPSTGNNSQAGTNSAEADAKAGVNTANAQTQQQAQLQHN